jgi:CDGSH-type Zn-finger protein
MAKQPEPSITVSANGPYLVSGAVPLSKQHIVVNAKGESVGWREGQTYAAGEKYALCRCGQSANKPFCDGTHKKVAFDGAETASREPYQALAQEIPGPVLNLEDAESLCAFARFCDTHGQIWNLMESTDKPETRRIVEQQAGHCPGGRLVVIEGKNGHALEPKLQPSIGLVEDTAERVSGALWVRGGIPVFAADGTAYEVRNRVTLCRCGASKNKPFCDGSHASTGFSDEK